MLGSVLLKLLPIALIVYLIIRRGFAADTSGVIGRLLTLTIAAGYSTFVAAVMAFRMA
jgi:hypothetical protein